MKKTVLMLSCLVLSVFFLVGCGDEEPQVSAPTPEAPPANETSTPALTDNEAFTGEFLIWIDDENLAEAFIPELEAKFPNVTFFWELMSHTESLTALSLDGPAGLGADLIFFPHDHVHRAITEQLVLPLGPELSNMMDGRLHAAAVQTVYDEVSGFHFGIPIITETVALFYNRTLLEENGLQVPSTFEELLDQVEELNADSSVLGDFNLRLNVGDPYHQHFALTGHGFQLFGPTHNDPDLANFGTPEAIAGLDWLAYVRNRVFNVPSADIGDNFAAFVEGEVAYFITGPWHINNILTDGDFELGIAKIPTIGGVQPVTFSGNRIVAGSGFTQNAALTRAVLEFVSSDAGFQILYDVRGDIPTLIDGSVITGLADNPLHMGILAQANYSHPMPIIPEMAHFWSVSGGMYSAVWDGVLSPVEAAEHAQLGYDSARALAEQ